MANKKILVVDDDRTTAKVIELQLLKMGYAVVSIAKSGLEAIKKTKSYHPDLLLMDVKLGKGMDGIETARFITQKYNVPIIYLTAYSDDDILKRALETKPLGYVNKPLRENDLRTTISLAFDRINTKEKNESSQNLIKESEQWSIKITINPEGGVSQLKPKIIERLNDYGFDTIEDLLPENNKELTNTCRFNNKQQLVTGKIGGKMFSWEYSPTRGQSVNVTITDISESYQLKNDEFQSLFLQETLDQLTTGIFLLDENLKLYYSNKSGKRILNSDNGFILNDGYINGHNPEASAELRRRILDGNDHLFPIKNGPETKLIHALLTPLKNYKENFENNLPLVIIYTFGTPDNFERIEEVLRSLYKLSPSEAKLSAQLVLTPSVDQVAQSLGISVNTVRTHLKRIYAKTNVNRQSAFLHMIITGPIGLILHTDG